MKTLIELGESFHPVPQLSGCVVQSSEGRRDPRAPACML
jgi:hypothetical protein